MNKNWSLVIVAALFEVMWVSGLKYANHFFTWLLTIVAIVISYVLLIYSGKKLPTSTVYVVFVGLGTAGTVLSEMIWFGAPFSSFKLLFIVTLLIGIIGLKMVSYENKEANLNKEGDNA